MGGFARQWRATRTRLLLFAGINASLVLGSSFAHAQFRPDYWQMQAESERARAEQELAHERELYEATLAERSARAHARMLEEGGYSAGLSSSVDWQAAHPNMFGAGSSPDANYTYVAPPQRRTWWSSHLPGLDFPIWQDVAPEDEPIDSLYHEYISEQIVQTHCINCHREGSFPAAAPNSLLQFSPKTVENYVVLNRAVLENLVAVLEEDEEVEDSVAYILNKVSGGITHQGGTPVPTGTADYANLERFLRQVAEDSGAATPGLTPETLFEGVTMASPARTLRRAAILFAGRLPTQAERDAVAEGEDATLRSTIRGLMNGEKFHDFLIRASNDRLLTDRQIDKVPIDLNDGREFVELTNKHWQMAVAALSQGHETRWHDPAYVQWVDAVTYGLARAPLELVAHVVENDLPYTEILTADFIMANPMAAEGYGAATLFSNVDDQYEFKPSEIVRYYRNDDSKIAEHDPRIGIHIVNPGNLLTDYPHAGILNTSAFLKRYPSTATNRNRARSRWTYYHFLGLDVEKSAARTIDPLALVDTNNPTLNNPACTVCHTVLDPVAGAFQNYGDEGLYRHQQGGLDSLPRLYKRPEDGSITPYQEGDTWYRDMRDPGFGDEVAPDSSNSVQWLAQRIVADDRIAEAAVKFWWQPIMGVDILDAPEGSSDADYMARSVAAQAQAAEVSRLAAAFRTGIEGGSAYNGKDLLTEIALSPWFRAESYAGEDSVREAALRDGGVARLLTPEELDRKTEAVAEYVWGRRFKRTMNYGRGEQRTTLNDTSDDGASAYQLLYGGINSDGIITRAVEMTPVMGAVAQAHAAEVSCPIVMREFFLWDDSNRLLFEGIDRFDTPVSESNGQFDVTANTWEARQTFSLEAPLAAGTKTLLLAFANDYYDDENDRDRNLNVDRISVADSTDATVANFELESLGEGGCGSSRGNYDSFYTITGEHCSVEIPFEVFYDDVYRVDIVAHQDQAGDQSAQMTVVVESDDGVSAGARTIRSKLVDLHKKLLGVDVAVNSPDVDEAFNLFFEVWSWIRRTEGAQFGHAVFRCDDNDHAFYDVLDSDMVVFNEWGRSSLDWNRVDELYDNIDMRDPSHAVRAWVVTLAFLMTDFRYLHF